VYFSAYRPYYSSTIDIVKVDEQVACRIDHYQTADQVHVSVFAKKTDKERSIVKFEAESVRRPWIEIMLLIVLTPTPGAS
jgi:hypothetical protein